MLSHQNRIPGLLVKSFFFFWSVGEFTVKCTECVRFWIFLKASTHLVHSCTPRNGHESSLVKACSLLCTQTLLWKGRPSYVFPFSYHLWRNRDYESHHPHQYPCGWNLSGWFRDQDLGGSWGGGESCWTSQELSWEYMTCIYSSLWKSNLGLWSPNQNP